MIWLSVSEYERWKAGDKALTFSLGPYKPPTPEEAAAAQEWNRRVWNPTEEERAESNRMYAGLFGEVKP